MKKILWVFPAIILVGAMIYLTTFAIEEFTSNQSNQGIASGVAEVPETINQEPLESDSFEQEVIFTDEDIAKLNEIPFKDGLSECIFPHNVAYQGNRVTTKKAINLDADHYTIVDPEPIIRDTPEGQFITNPGIDVNTTPEQMDKLLCAAVTMFEPYFQYNGRQTTLHYQQVVEGDVGKAYLLSQKQGLTSNLSLTQLGLEDIILDSDWAKINTLIGTNSKYYILEDGDKSHGSGYIFENKIGDVYIIASQMSASTSNMDTNQETFLSVEYQINNLYFYEKYIEALRECGMDMYPVDTYGEIRVIADNRSILIYQSGDLNSRLVNFAIKINPDPA